MTAAAPPPSTPQTHRSAQLVPVAEMFHSFQGEGASLGRRALFVRFMDCNLTCGYSHRPATGGDPIEGSMLCDTAYTWNSAAYDLHTGVRELTPEEIWQALIALDPATADPAVTATGLVVLSGGEPLLRKDAVVYLTERARASGRQVEIETNATLRPGPDLIAAGARFNAGLKLASSAIPRGKRIKPEAIGELQACGQTRWKFVIATADDLAEVAALQREFALTDIWLSPEGITPAAIMARMRLAAEAALTRGWNLTTRAHILIWGAERGR